jgi:hypothetical protein
MSNPTYTPQLSASPSKERTFEVYPLPPEYHQHQRAISQSSEYGSHQYLFHHNLPAQQHQQQQHGYVLPGTYQQVQGQHYPFHPISTPTSANSSSFGGSTLPTPIQQSYPLPMIHTSGMKVDPPQQATTAHLPLPTPTPTPTPSVEDTYTKVKMSARARKPPATRATAAVQKAKPKTRTAPLKAIPTNSHIETAAISNTEGVIPYKVHPQPSRPSAIGSKNRSRPPPSHSQLVFPLRGQRGPLLPVPPGAILEVQALLLLHPPSQTDSPPNAKSKTQAPINQYNKGTCGNGDKEGGEGYKSKFEMYTCRVCAKTYDGRNARSVARRHLQDKHGVPLKLQGRRSRWDDGESLVFAQGSRGRLS